MAFVNTKWYLNNLHSILLLCYSLTTINNEQQKRNVDMENFIIITAIHITSVLNVTEIKVATKMQI
jgi:hypothetical protein